jgi:transposase
MGLMSPFSRFLNYLPALPAASGTTSRLRASFVPPEPIRQLRDLTRTRSNLTHERTREYSRLEKGLEDSSIKLSSVVSTLSTRSARNILDALISGERDPQTLASLAHASMGRKSAALVEALTGRSPTTTHTWRGSIWTASTRSRRPSKPSTPASIW